MRLLQRKAQDLGVELTFISNDERVRQRCAEAGLASYPDTRSFQRSTIRGRYYDKPPERPKPPWGSRASLLSAICLLALTVGALYFILPAATIIVTPATQPLSLRVSVVADQSLDRPDVAAGKIPARFLSTEVTGQATVLATGRRAAPDQRARGLVSFTNRTSKPVTVPKSTVVMAGQVAFATTQDTLVSPTLTIAGTAIPGSGESSIQAVDPGKQGNVPAGAIAAVEGPLAAQLTVQNEIPTTGGSTRQARFLSQADQTSAKDALRKQLTQRALAQLRAAVPAHDTFLPDPASLTDSAIEQLTFEQSPALVTRQTVMHMRLLVKGLAFQGKDVNTLVQRAAESAARQRGSQERLVSGSLAIQPPTVLNNNGRTIRLMVPARGELTTSLSSGAISQAVRGLGAGQARRALLRMPGVKAADVQLWPGWARQVPALSWRVGVTLAEPATP